jgi:hypothetical protein
VHDVGGGVFCFSVLGFGVRERVSLSGSVLLCTRVIINFAMDENELVFENVGGIDEIALNMSTISFHSLS